MGEYPYLHAPDLFWLRLLETPAELEVLPFETAFGTTDEFLCYYRGGLIGLIVPHNNDNGLLVNLLPVLDPDRKYSWPSAQKFELSLSDLLKDARSWILVCERDCDQQPVPELLDSSVIHNELSRVYAYCNGLSNLCPSFSAKDGDV